MKAHKLLTGRWPRQGVKQPTIDAFLQKALKTNLAWGKWPVLGFPSMAPDAFAVSVYCRFIKRHCNAILTHTRGKGEKGFDGIKPVEKAVVYMLADLLGIGNHAPIDDLVDGYIASGGTEANIMGVWIGREKLRSEVRDETDQRVALVTTSFAHYSVRKAAALTGIGEGHFVENGFVDFYEGHRPTTLFIPAADGSGLHYVKADYNGSINVPALEQKIRLLHADKGMRRFIIVLNEGSTMTGSLDSVQAVGTLLCNLKRKLHDCRFYVHVDAAYGGFIYPFTETGYVGGFSVPEVDSVTVDPYKMGQAPMAQGVFLCRKHLQVYTQRQQGYIQEEFDDTLIGSRTGAHAAACFALIHFFGFKGYRAMHMESIRLANAIHSKFSKVSKLDMLPRQLNMVSFYLPSNLSYATHKRVHDLVTKYRIMWALISEDCEDPNRSPRRMMKFNITKDVDPKWVDKFFKEFVPLLS